MPTPLPRRAAERVNVGLLEEPANDLEELKNRSGLTKTDLINRAISLYAMLYRDVKIDGKELLLADPDRKNIERLRIGFGL